MTRQVAKATTSPFDSIRQVEGGQEYWSARDLQKLLGYTQWRNFEETIQRAMISCKVAGEGVSDHFAEVSKPIKGGKGAIQRVRDYRLTRFACYSIAMNGDVEKPSIALAQTYFNIQTRKAELTEASQPPMPQINSLWQQRLEIFNRETHLPEGYWCIYGFVAGHCWTDEFRDVYLIEEALPDGSIGKRWCNHVRERGYDMRLVKKYPHRYPDKRGVQWANIYPNEWLGEFWTWFHGQYLKYDYPEYLKTHQRALQAPEQKKQLSPGKMA
ncbi:MAG TPA: BRO family protein [Ktedonobacteraceae bacterium]|nr:BRO family protein [Ktedonobacteraceae bacterium]